MTEKSNNIKQEKGFWGKLIDQLDKKLETKAKTQGCCCRSSKDEKDSSCCS